MDGKLHAALIPPVTKEFIEAMKQAFPNKDFGPEGTLSQFQRNAGQQEVIRWAYNFMVNRDPANRTIRDR